MKSANIKLTPKGTNLNLQFIIGDVGYKDAILRTKQFLGGFFGIVDRFSH